MGSYLRQVPTDLMTGNADSWKVIMEDTTKRSIRPSLGFPMSAAGWTKQVSKERRIRTDLHFGQVIVTPRR